MADKQKIRFHRRVGFNVDGAIRFVDAGDYVDLPKEITESPYFAAVMGEGYAEQLGAGPAMAEPNAALLAAQAEAEKAKAEVVAVKAALAEAQEQAQAAQAARAELEKALAEAAEPTKTKKV